MRARTAAVMVGLGALVVILVTGCLRPVEEPREVIAALPVLNASKQCPNGDCDRTLEHQVMLTLDSLALAHLTKGMSLLEVRELFGPPADRHGEKAWRDPVHGNEVTVWTYATSLSGTKGFHLVFVNGCLDGFGWHQTSALWIRYGRPKWSSPVETGEGYRFTGRETRVCPA